MTKKRLPSVRPGHYLVRVLDVGRHEYSRPGRHGREYFVATLEIVRRFSYPPEGEEPLGEGEQCEWVRSIGGMTGAIVETEAQMLQEHVGEVLELQAYEKVTKAGRSFIMSDFNPLQEPLRSSHETYQVLEDWALSKGLTREQFHIDTAGGIYIRPGAVVS